MARDRTVTLRIPEDTFLAAVRAARAEEQSLADLMRAALSQHLAEMGGAPEDPVVALRRDLRRIFAAASDWVDLQRRLRATGFVLRDRDGTLWLCAWPRERALAPLARFGTTPEELSALFRAPFPAYGPRTAKPAAKTRRAA